jgi:hypothetical protein
MDASPLPTLNAPLRITNQLKAVEIPVNTTQAMIIARR